MSVAPSGADPFASTYSTVYLGHGSPTGPAPTPSWLPHKSAVQVWEGLLHLDSLWGRLSNGNQSLGGYPALHSYGPRLPKCPRDIFRGLSPGEAGKNMVEIAEYHDLLFPTWKAWIPRPWRSLGERKKYSQSWTRWRRFFRTSCRLVRVCASISIEK